MRSIRAKISLTTMMAVMVSVILISIVGTLFIRNEGERDSDQEMTLLCDTKRNTLDEFMKSIEQSVDTVADYAAEDLSAEALTAGGVAGVQGFGAAMAGRNWQGEQQARLDEYLAAHVEKVDAVFRSVAAHTGGVVAYYYRLNPEITDAHPGFLYTSTGASAYSSHSVSNIFSYPLDDISHVGWYAVPLEQGHSAWLKPYDNANLDQKTISYVTPIYKDGTFIGVAGMDISYETLVEQITDIRMYDTGYACLLDEEGAVVYHPTLEAGTRTESILPALAEAAEDPAMPENGVYLFRYQYEGLEKKAVSARLENGLRLMIMAPSVEINESWREMVKGFLFIGGAILLVFAIVTAFATQRIIEPLQTLAGAAKRLADGELDVKLEYSGNDELGVMTASFQRLAERLKTYINDLNGKAYKDELTNVKNKGAYDIMARKMDDDIPPLENEEPLKFAVVICDCNFMKIVNDQFGHDKGDIYLKTACTFICKVFAHSPVFRVGGDEFVSILQSEDYERREELLKLFDELSALATEQAERPWEEVSISKGMAVYDPEKDRNVQDVLSRAEECMKKEKNRMQAVSPR